MLVYDRLVPRVYAQARAPAHSGLNPVIMPYFHSTFDLAMTRVLGLSDDDSNYLVLFFVPPDNYLSVLEYKESRFIRVSYYGTCVCTQRPVF